MSSCNHYIHKADYFYNIEHFPNTQFEIYDFSSNNSKRKYFNIMFVKVILLKTKLDSNVIMTLICCHCSNFSLFVYDNERFDFIHSYEIVNKNKFHDVNASIIIKSIREEVSINKYVHKTNKNFKYPDKYITVRFDMIRTLTQLFCEYDLEDDDVSYLLVQSLYYVEYFLYILYNDKNKESLRRQDVDYMCLGVVCGIFASK
jgi:hypothetical protein